jgi:hypothetical protein
VNNQAIFAAGIMKSLAHLLPVMLLFTTSCNQEEKKFSDTVIHAKADSIVGLRAMELNQQAMDDLEKRMAIEVKAKADSIIAARNPQSPKPGKVAPQANDTPTDTVAMRSRSIFKVSRRPNYDTPKR